MAAALQNFGNVGKGLAAAIAAGGLLAHFLPAAQQSLGLVAARAIPRPWTLLTCAFFNDSIITSLAYAVAVLFLARIVEPIYGARELLKYLTVVVVLTSFLTVAVVTGLYYTQTRSEEQVDDVLFRPLGGFEAGLAALLVAVKQLIPDNEVALLGGALKFRAKHLPGLYVVAMVGICLVLGGAIRVLPFTLFGAYLAWAYLRYAHTSNGVRGDLSEEFRLASFFPQPLQPAIDRIAAACTRITGLGAASGSQAQQAAYSYGLGGGVLPGSDSGDAARRRERGAKALEERLGFKKAASAASAPAVPPGATQAAGGNHEQQQQPAADPAALDVEAGVVPPAEAS